MSISHQGNSLTINDNIITFPLNIAQVIDVEGLVIVRLRLEGENNIMRNVYAYDRKGNLIWTIQEPHIQPSGTFPIYSFIRIEDGKLIAGNTVGYDYFVDLKTGEVTCTNPNARPW